MIRTILALALVAALAAPAGAQEQPTVDPAKDSAHWTRTFHDEFNGRQLDRTKWIDSYPDNQRTHSNNEQQYYAENGWEVGSGRLRLKGEDKPTHGMRYSSGMVSSYGKFAQQYGWFEIRCRLPKGKGMWPAFWLLPANKTWPPEIDVLEVLGHEPNKVYTTNHYVDASGKHQSRGGSYTGPDFSADYHTFAVDWEPKEIVWYVDGVERFRSTEGIPHEPMYILANLAIGGDWPGMPDADTHFPAYMDIDYVRVYQRKGGAAAQVSAPDATVASWARAAVADLSSTVLLGYPDGKVHGEDTVPRREVATALARYAQRSHVADARVSLRPSVLLAAFAPAAQAPHRAPEFFKDIDLEGWTHGPA